VTAFTLVGAGALGRAIASVLSAGGCQVTLLARPARAARLIGAGRLRTDGVVGLEVPVRAGTGQPPGTVGVVDRAQAIPAEQAVIFATKGPDLPAAAADVRRWWQPGPAGRAWVAGLQNGVAKDDVLRAAFGRDRVVGAATTLGARTAVGAAGAAVVLTGTGRTFLGEFGPAPDDRLSPAVSAFVRVGMPTEVVTDIRRLLWMKCCNAVGVFGVTATTRLPTTIALRDQRLAGAYLTLLAEAVAVASASGVEVADYPGLPVKTYTSLPERQAIAAVVANTPLPDHREQPMSSMAQDVIAGRPTEVAETIGDLLARAVGYGVDVSGLRLTYRLIAGLDRRIN
jgi:2-dehydropantoate 2-reductase